MASVSQSDNPEVVTRCPELDLTAFSSHGELLPQGSAVDALDFEESDISISSSVKELEIFEVLENAAENDESFSSTLSYADRLWSARSYKLMPPSSFENPVEAEELFSNTLCNDITSLFHVVYASQPDDPQELHRSPEKLDPESPDSDDDTRSLASISLFQDAIPVITSTPPSHLRKRKPQLTAQPGAGDEKRDSLPPSNLVRQLFPFTDKPLKLPETGKDKVPADVVSAENLTRKSPVACTLGAFTSRSADARLQSARSINVGDGIVIQELQEKVTEMKLEIAKFKTENSKLVKARLEHEAALKQLEKARDIFNSEKKQRLHQIEEIKQMEMKHIEMEKRILFKHVSSQKLEDSRRLTEANDELRTEVNSLRDEGKKAEERYLGSTSRLRDRIKALETENSRLRDRVDELGEEKQELLREVVRLSRSRSSGKAFSMEEKTVQTAFPVTENHPRSSFPQPTTDADCSSVSPSDFISPTKENVSPLSSSRSILKAAEKSPSPLVTSAKNVHFDVDASICSSTPKESFTEENIDGNGILEQRFKDGRRVRIYKNGTKKEISPDGKCSTTSYFNGDILQVNLNLNFDISSNIINAPVWLTYGRKVFLIVIFSLQVYFYNANQSVETKYPDGTEVLQFANNQIEKLLTDGSREIQFPNKVVKTFFPNGNQQTKYPDENVLYWNEKSRTRTVYFKNGEIEIHTDEWKKRKFVDGSEKVVFADGRTETRYSNGRIRVKDRSGKLLFDTEGSSSTTQTLPLHQPRLKT